MRYRIAFQGFSGWLVLVLSITIFFSKAYGASNLQKVNIGYPSLNFTQASLWIAREAGFFAKNGLDAQLIFLRGGTRLSQALLAGNIALGVSAGPSVVVSRAAGADEVIVAGMANRPLYDFIAGPRIKKPEDLGGKRVAISGMGGAAHAAALLALKHLGLEVKRNRITLIQLGGMSEQVAALRNGSVDASPINPGFSRKFVDAGFIFFGNLGEMGIPFQQTCLITRQLAIKTNPDLIARAVLSVQQAAAYLHNTANKGAVVKILMTYLKLSSSSEVEEGYQLLLRNHERKLYPTLAGMRSLVELMKDVNPKAGELNAESLVDSQFIRKLDESGVIDRMYQ